MKIYLDVALITNTAVTLLCLEMTAKIIHRTIANKRAFIASSVGGLTSLMIVLTADSYPVAVLITVLKLLSFPLIAAIAFKFKSITNLVRNTAVFFAANLLYVGIVLLLWELSDTKIIFIRNYTIYFNVSIFKLTVSVIITYILLTAVEMVRKISNTADKYSATYTCGNYHLSIPAIADTGNRLCDRFSSTPVVIFYCDDLYFHFDLDSPEVLSSGKFRLLPFDTISGSGLIPVTYGGKVEIYDESSRFTDLRCCVGITRSNGKGARAIFNPEIIN